MKALLSMSFNMCCICGYLAHKKVISLVSCWSWKLLCADLSFRSWCQFRGQTDGRLVIGSAAQNSLGIFMDVWILLLMFRTFNCRVIVLIMLLTKLQNGIKNGPAVRLERVSVRPLNPSSVVLGSWFMTKKDKVCLRLFQHQAIYFRCGVHGLVQGLCGTPRNGVQFSP